MEPQETPFIAPPAPTLALKEKLITWVKSAGFKKYFQNTSWLFLTKFVSLIVTFFVTAYVVRYLGPTNYGDLSYAVSFVSIFSFIATFGIDQVLYRDLIKYPDQREKYLGTAMILKTAAGIVATVLTIVGAFFTSSKNDISLFLILIISLTYIFNPLQMIAYEFQADVKSKYPSIISMVIVFVLNALKFVAAFYGKGIIYFAFILLLESLLNAVLYIWLRYAIYGRLFRFTYDKEIGKSLMKDSWPLIFSSAFALIYARIDQVLIKHMIDTASVGLYDTAVRMTELWYFIPNIIVTSFFPAIVNARLFSEKDYNHRLGVLALTLTALTVGVALPVAIFAKQLMFIIYGQAFVGGAAVLQIYIWSCIWTALANLATNYLVAENFRRILFISYFAAMASNVILNLLWIPHYGITGSAWATFVSYFIGPFVLIFFKETRYRIFAVTKNLLSHAL